MNAKLNYITIGKQCRGVGKDHVTGDIVLVKLIKVCSGDQFKSLFYKSG